jgi:hypothetical protein
MKHASSSCICKRGNLLDASWFGMVLQNIETPSRLLTLDTCWQGSTEQYSESSIGSMTDEQLGVISKMLSCAVLVFSSLQHSAERLIDRRGPHKVDTCSSVIKTLHIRMQIFNTVSGDERILPLSLGKLLQLATC